MQYFEMGGYLSLELREGMSHFRDLPKENVLEVNTGRTAIKCAIQSLSAKRVYVPYYYCPDIMKMLSSLEIELSYYHIGEDLLPVNLDVEDDAAVILVNYFGVISEKIKQVAESYSKVILDQAHGFFVAPVLRKGVMNVYSCRKFFGVCDGAYLIGEDLAYPNMERDISCYRAIHLLKSLECGTNGAYEESKYNEQELGKAALFMSTLTNRILGGIDYSSVEAKRRSNFRYLHRRLADIQQLKGMDENSAAYMYPLLLNKDIHKALVREHIYVPLLWQQLMSSEWNGTLEQKYASCIVPLPMDQRYDENDLARLIEIVERICHMS